MRHNSPPPVVRGKAHKKKYIGEHRESVTESYIVFENATRTAVASVENRGHVAHFQGAFAETTTLDLG